MIALAVLAGTIPKTRADYLMLLSSGGKGSVEVRRGESVSIDLDLLTNADDRQNVAIVRMEFSSPGLIYEDYQWWNPYSNEGDDDDSEPGRSSLPVLLVGGEGNSAAVELSNFISTPERFASGRLLSFKVRVPEDYSGPGTVTVTPAAATIANGLVRIPAASGQGLMIHIPERPIEHPADDDDGDGLPNFVEYALGLDPEMAGAPPMTRTSPGLPVFAIESAPSGPALKFTYRKYPGRMEVGYQVQSSTDLIHWQDEPDVLDEVVGEAEIRHVEFSLAGQGKFVRLLIFRRMAP